MAVLAIIGVCLVLGIIAIASVKFLGPNNEVEEAAIHIMEKEVETQIHMAPDYKVDEAFKKNENK